MLNLWSWQDTHGEAHVGVSEGPDMDHVVDLTKAHPDFDSVEALWRAAGSNLKAFLKQAMEGTTAALDPRQLRVPVLLSECWAAGVTYEMSRDARVKETHGAEQFYRKVYEAERPELFFKAPGSRVVGPHAEVGLRPDSAWQIPEPELTVILDPAGQIFGFTVGNDMSCRDIEGDNPLYLPQAKIYHQSAAIGPSIVLAGTLDPRDLEITLTVRRGDQTAFAGSVRTEPNRCGEPLRNWSAICAGRGPLGVGQPS